MRETVVIHSRHSWRKIRGNAAIERRHGLQALSIELLAARLSGGFLQPIESNALKSAIGEAISVDLGEFNGIKELPGFPRAAAATLEKAWAAGLDFTEMANAGDAAVRRRLDAIVRLETEVLRILPSSMWRPADLVAQALTRLKHANALFGPIRVLGRTEMSPVWRPLLGALSGVTEVVWVAGPRHVPSWVHDLRIAVVESPLEHPNIQRESCASPRHEVVEAMRWARALLASGQAKPEEIAIAAASPEEWDDHFLAVSEMSGLDLHFVRGRKALTTTEGQLAAALAELLLRGFSQARMTRLVALLRTQNLDFSNVPGDWWRVLPENAPLLDAPKWREVLGTITDADLDNARPVVRTLTGLVDALALGLKQAVEVGERVLRARSLAIWKEALTEGPPEALDVTLASLRVPDQVPQETSVIWTPASSLAADPRPYVRLIGLSSRAWPRHQAEDPLLPNHIIASSLLEPLPVHEADRRDFDTIIRTTPRQVVCSHARRDAQGRLNGLSPLYPKAPAEIYRQRARIPEHAAGWSDRLFARPAEFEALPNARSAHACWIDWHSDRLTAHDGLMRANHPLVVAALCRRQSATSLTKLLRDPLAYLWTYGFRWEEPHESEEPLQLDALSFGNVLHSTLEVAVTRLETANAGGVGAASETAMEEAVTAASAAVAEEWMRLNPVPPPVIWNRKLQEIRGLAIAALAFQEEALANQRSWAEIPFGGDARVADLTDEIRRRLPWDPSAAVVIPGTTVSVGGSIDRLDLAGDGTIARVTDYKSGRPPGSRKPMVKGGAELQRCLYAYAVRALVPGVTTVETRLLYPKAGNSGLCPLVDTAAVLESLACFVRIAQSYVLAGDILPGAGAENEFNDLAFALPGGAKQSYFATKSPLVVGRLTDLAPLWEME